MKRYDNLLKSNNPAQALVELTKQISTHPEDAEAYYIRGRIYWRIGDRPKATSDYATAASLDPESPAVMALQQARDIENFFNPDLLNP